MNSNSENNEHTKIFTAVFFAGIILNICFTFPLLGHSKKIAFTQIDNKLNPNTASVYELAELPSLGPAKAQGIIEYRCRKASLSGQNRENAFNSADDLDNVKGFGKKTIEKVKQWLVFDENRN